MRVVGVNPDERDLLIREKCISFGNDFVFLDEGGGAGRAEMLFLVKILTTTMLVMMLSNKPKSKVKCLTPIMPVRLQSNKQRQEAGKGFTRRLVFVVFVSFS